MTGDPGSTMASADARPWTPLPARHRIALGEAWAGNGVNCQTYRHHGIFSRNGLQAGCFFDPSGGLVVFTRDLATGEVARAALPGIPQPHDAHHSPSIAIDAAGRIHVLGGAHVTDAFYVRAERACDLKTLALVEDPALTLDGPLSYPSFLVGETDSLSITYRTGVPGRGAWRVRRWIEEQVGWSIESSPLADGVHINRASSSPYFNNPLREHQGRFGFFTVWRTGSLPGSGDHVRNIGLDYFESSTERGHPVTWAGLKLPLPVTPVVSERVVAVPWNGGLSNQAGATRLPDGRPFAAFLAALDGRQRQIYVAWPDRTGQWKCQTISRFQAPSSLTGKGTLYLPHSRPACAALLDGSVIILCRTAESGNGLVAWRLLAPDFRLDTAQKYLLCDEDLGFYEPVIDISLAEATGRLCAYVQACRGAADNARPDTPSSAPGRLMEWTLPLLNETVSQEDCGGLEAHGRQT